MNLNQITFQRFKPLWLVQNNQPVIDAINKQQKQRTFSSSL